MMQISITDLRALDGDIQQVAVHILVLSEDGQRDTRTYYILPEQYASLRLRIGAIDSDTVDAIEEASALCEAIRRGLRLLCYGAQSERTLCTKLRARGIAPDTAAEAAAYLRTLGLMDECEDARRIVSACRRKHWGMRRILSHLYEKGYPETVLREMQQELEGEDFVSDCVALIRAKYHAVPGERGERQKMIAALTRYGYGMGEIRRAIDTVAREDAEE